MKNFNIEKFIEVLIKERECDLNDLGKHYKEGQDELYLISQGRIHVLNLILEYLEDFNETGVQKDFMTSDVENPKYLQDMKKGIKGIIEETTRITEDIK